MLILILEGVCEMKSGEKSTNRGHEQFQFGLAGKIAFVMLNCARGKMSMKEGCRWWSERTMINDQVFHIAHNLSVALVRIGSDCLESLAVFLVDRRGLGMQDKGNRQQPLSCSVSISGNKRSRHTLIHSIWMHVRRLSFPQEEGRELTS